MGKSQRERRRQRRRKAAAEGSSIHDVLRSQKQKDGALGIITCVAHLAGEYTSEQPSKLGSEVISNSVKTNGLGFVLILEQNPGKLSADALAATAEIWPDEQVRRSASDALQRSQSQPSGILRELGQSAVHSGFRLTNEYRDSEVLFIELSSGGQHLATVAATTDSFRRSRISLDAFRVDSDVAADTFEFDDEEQSKARRVFEPLGAQELRRETWMLSSKRKVEGDPVARTLFSWCLRILEVDCPWPQIPKFAGHEIDDADDDEIDLLDELGSFLLGAEGQPWDDERFEAVTDHLESYEFGDRQMLWSPARVEDFLLFTDHRDVASHAHVLPALLRSWVTHCAQIRRQRKPLLLEVLAEIDRCEPLYFADLGHSDVA